MNTFGGSTKTQFPLVDPRSLRAERKRFRREFLPLLELANSFQCSTGRWSSRGWLLLSRSDYNKLDLYSTSLQLNIGNTTDPNNVKTLQNLSIVQARCVTRGLASDPNAVYLIEVVDDRGILSNDWFQAPVVTQYNMRSPAYPQTFNTGSMNGGTTWTWSTMLQDLWEKMNVLSAGGVLGAWPGLPTVPAGTPEGFSLQGVGAWDALNDIVEHLGMTVACDLTQTNPFTIVVPGNVDTSFNSLRSRFIKNFKDDLEWIDTGAARVPLNVTVLFRRRNSIYGSEETVRYDSLQWDINSVYSVTITAPAFFTGAVGAHYIWSDFTVRYDQDGVPLATDTSMASTIAQERVTQYYAKIYRQTAGFMTKVYSGALPFTTGSRVDGVRWYQDYSVAPRDGWCTKIVSGPYPPFHEIRGE